MNPLRPAVGTAIAAIALLVAAPDARAADAQYTVLKCHAYSRSASEVEAAAAGPYQTADSCGGADHRLEVTVNGFGLPGQSGSVLFTAPDNTAIVGVIADANLRRDNHHFAQLAVVDYQGNPRVLAQGSDTGAGFQPYSFSGLNDLRFVVQLFCSDPGGCPNSAQAHAYVRNIAIVLADRNDPGVTEVGGTLFDGGWLRGEKMMEIAAADLGSGLATISTFVNGAEIAQAPARCNGTLGPASALLVPCPVAPAGADLAVPADTTRAPFTQGLNSIKLCVRDFAGNAPSCSPFTVSVDNEPPGLAFPAALDTADPELITVRAVELHSGVDPQSVQIAHRIVGGAQWTVLPTRLVNDRLQARVDSGSLPPGKYEFMASARDIAGNASQTALRTNGEPATFTFPLREPVQLVARVDGGSGRTETLAYGRDSDARGRLLNANGEPMDGREIIVSEYFGSGALIDRRVRTVVTDARGRWTSKLPAGPSRDVEISFAGTLQHQPRTASSTELRVRSRASLETSRERVREGDSVEFIGKVGHFGARIPSGGKLIELQVQEAPGRWNTVREAFHTNSSGRFAVSYRFGRFYEANATFVFRIKVAREQGWPYEAPGRSRSQTVTVVADR